jgi:tetratricopeptide (TPR) repeat protein
MVFKAAEVLERVLALDADNERALAVKADMMMQTRGLDRSRSAYEKLIKIRPEVAVYWLKYGYLLKTLGESGKAVAAYRTALALDPNSGQAWWALADLKNTRLFASDIDQMETALKNDDLSDKSKVPIHYAMGKALDASKKYERAIWHIEQGSKIRLEDEPEPARTINGDGAIIRAAYTRDFFAQREGWGDPRSGPIFILGMHRAGSTLVEQILSSHSQIEGSEELFIISKFSSELAHAHPQYDTTQIVKSIEKGEFSCLGERYLEISSRSRQTNRPYLTDKYPGNWKHIGFIHCMLPNCKIIDVRRNPMDCCFANYFQYYATALNYSFSQKGMAAYYSDYVETMRHFDEVLPGRIYRLIHDDLVDNFEEEVGRLLEYLNVPFEESCLRFYETQRPVHTPSSEQVRRPINRSGFGRWRNYEPWLSELKESLGETLTNWRN